MMFRSIVCSGVLWASATITKQDCLGKSSCYYLIVAKKYQNTKYVIIGIRSSDEIVYVNDMTLTDMYNVCMKMNDGNKYCLL